MTKYRRKQLALRSHQGAPLNTLASGKAQCSWADVWFAISMLLACMVFVSVYGG